MIENEKRGKRKEPLVVIASNRGPYKFKSRRDGKFHIERGAGGLVTALSGLAERHEILWVASAMRRSDRRWSKLHNDQPQVVQDVFLRLIRHKKKLYEQYYNEISNPLLWFIQHQLWDIPRSPSITKDTYEAWHEGYLGVNKAFADGVADTVEGYDCPIVIFPQDYHLYLMPHYLRQRLGYSVQIQPFLHIPWPGPDAWRILPSGIRNSILESLLESDRVGFQTKKDAFNFVQTCRFYLKDAHSRGSRDTIYYHDRVIKARDYPISIDIEKVQKLAEEPKTKKSRERFANSIGDRKVILRVDRVEPSKNILRGLEAYRTMLDTYPEHIDRVQLLVLLVPSRLEVSEYQDYLRDIMAEVGLINARFSLPSWEAVRVIVGDNYQRALAAMQIYDVLMVNPLADGMNLVAKEGALVNQRDGVLVLSEYAGAYFELGDHSLTVSPFDVFGTAKMMHKALVMRSEKRKEMCEALKHILKKSDIRKWFQDQLVESLSVFENNSKNSSTPETSSTR